MVEHAKIEELIGYIEAFPEEWDQDHWVVETSCGTAYCLAGLACVQAGYSLQWDTTLLPLVYARNGRCMGNVPEAARKLLGLNTEQGKLLFWGDNSLDDLKKAAKSFYE